MTCGRTSRIDTSTLWFLAPTTGMVIVSKKTLVNRSYDLLVERFLVFSLIFLDHFGSPLLFRIKFAQDLYPALGLQHSTTTNGATSKLWLRKAGTRLQIFKMCDVPPKYRAR